jgi:hypothetical protein
MGSIFNVLKGSWEEMESKIELRDGVNGTSELPLLHDRRANMFCSQVCCGW